MNSNVTKTKTKMQLIPVSELLVSLDIYFKKTYYNKMLIFFIRNKSVKYKQRIANSFSNSYVYLRMF